MENSMGNFYNRKVSKPKLVRQDITESFFAKCEKLGLGELTMKEGFSLSDAMSAVEIMDPNMDIGVVRHKREITVDALKEQGFLENITAAEILTTVDSTFSLVASYLEGSTISTTVYTNVFIVELRKLDHNILSPISNSFAYLVLYLRGIIMTAMTFHEEDFNHSLPFIISPGRNHEQIVADLTTCEAVIMKNKHAASDPAEKSAWHAISLRVRWLRLFLELLAHIVPPLGDFQEGYLITRGFQPNIMVTNLADQLVAISEEFAQTCTSGLPREKYGDFCGNDENFGWVPGIDPQYNKRYLTGAFMRTTVYYTRRKAMIYFNDLSEALRQIVDVIPSKITDYFELVEFFRSVAEGNNGVLTRSILQIFVFPGDDLVLGTEPFCNLVDKAVKDMLKPLLFIEGTAHSQDEDCMALYGRFIEDFTKAALCLISTYGHNRSRQRQKMRGCVEDFAGTQNVSDRLDGRIMQLSREYPHLVPAAHPQHSIMTFTYKVIVGLLKSHFEMSFKLDLFAPHEYVDMFWYYSGVLGHWLLNAQERVDQMLTYEFKDVLEVVESSAKRKKMNSRMKKRHEQMKTKATEAHNLSVRTHVEAELSRGITQASIALIRLKMIPTPCWDHKTEMLRFEQRMKVASPLGPPLHLTYDQYLNVSRIARLFQVDLQLLEGSAIQSFEKARDLIARLDDDHGDDTGFIDASLRCANANIVAMKLLMSGRMGDRKVSWTRPDQTIIFPQLKFM